MRIGLDPDRTLRMPPTDLDAAPGFGRKKPRLKKVSSQIDPRVGAYPEACEWPHFDLVQRRRFSLSKDYIQTYNIRWDTSGERYEYKLEIHSGQLSVPQLDCLARAQKTCRSQYDMGVCSPPHGTLRQALCRIEAQYQAPSLPPCLCAFPSHAFRPLEGLTPPFYKIHPTI